jgi:ADP-ribose pyrophosphatase YjhB (NUDIX family)
MQKKTLSLVQLYNLSEILLGYKKRGFGKGMWNGYGGNFDPALDATIRDTATRELFEESGIDAHSTPEVLQPAGKMQIMFEGSEKLLEIHLFRWPHFFGTAQETNEMKPRWFSQDEIPFEKMWPNDRLWLPQFLAGSSVEATFTLDAAMKRVTAHEMHFFKPEHEQHINFH